MATKLGFSTGKGYIEKVDKAAQADNSTNATNATNATNTDITNSEWSELTENTVLTLGKTYEIKFYAYCNGAGDFYIDTYINAIFTVINETAKNQWITSYIYARNTPTYILEVTLNANHKIDGLVYIQGTSGANSLWSVASNAKYRELK